jgi:hypothetical protein
MNFGMKVFHNQENGERKNSGNFLIFKCMGWMWSGCGSVLYAIGLGGEEVEFGWIA